MSLVNKIETINLELSRVSNQLKELPTRRMPTFIISDINNHTSIVAVRKLLKSIEVHDCDLNPTIFPATTPNTLIRDLARIGKNLNNWTYPKIHNETRKDIKSGLTLKGYRSDNVEKVISCAVSHYRLWQICAAGNVPFVILEHDALFTRKLPIQFFSGENREAGIVGLNDPRGATRKAQIYLQKTLDSNTNNSGTVPVPWVDDNTNAPQGLAGNSAYVLWPGSAASLLHKVEDVGFWPNDALMCKQFFSSMRQAYPFFTTLQGVKSTTTG